MAHTLTDQAGCCQLLLSGADADGSVFVCLTDSDGNNHTIKVDAGAFQQAGTAAVAEATRTPA